MLRRMVAFLIQVYQKTISPDHSWLGRALTRWRYPHGFCRYQPSCSEYARLAILKYGVIVGMLKAGWRVLRCNPWSKGGVDEP